MKKVPKEWYLLDFLCLFFHWAKAVKDEKKVEFYKTFILKLFDQKCPINWYAFEAICRDQGLLHTLLGNTKSTDECYQGLENNELNNLWSLSDPDTLRKLPGFGLDPNVQLKKASLQDASFISTTPLESLIWQYNKHGDRDRIFERIISLVLSCRAKVTQNMIDACNDAWTKKFLGKALIVQKFLDLECGEPEELATIFLNESEFFSQPIRDKKLGALNQTFQLAEKEDFEFTLILFAAYKKRKDLFKMLLDAGVNIDENALAKLREDKTIDAFLQEHYDSSKVA